MGLAGSPVSAVDRALGVPVVESVGALVTRDRLRILAYHGVPDREPFRAHLHHLVRHYRPVTGADVAAAVRSGAPLPARAVWITFDDGRRSVVENALPELEAAGVPATMFICPGLLPEGSVFWQTIVLTALAKGGSYVMDGVRYVDRRLVVALKSEPDSRRRAVVEELSERLEGVEVPGDTVDEPELRRWLAAGHEVGNHTWDHPCLDRCEPEEQARQILRAHEALGDLLGHAPRLFAYPNGDWTPEAEAVLERAGYEVAPVFDHHLVAREPSPLRLSRLRIDADAPMDRLRAVLSGAHSGAFHARERLRSAAGR